MANLLNLVLVLLVIITGLSGFFISCRTLIESKVEKDIWLGDIADQVVQKEQRVNQINDQLHALHLSCFAMLAAPTPSTATSMQAARKLTKSLSKVQTLLRKTTQSILAKARARGYLLTHSLRISRLKNPCGFVGPLKDLKGKSMFIRDSNSGVQLSLQSPTTWGFRHFQSRKPWF